MSTYYFDILEITKCSQRCQQYTAGNPTALPACEAACRESKGTTPSSNCDFWEQVIGDQQSIAKYAIDCDPNSGSGSEMLKSITGAAGAKATYAIVAVVVILVLVLLWWYLKRRQQ